MDIKFICENCGKEHDGSYGSGRFCSNFCKNSYAGKYGGQKSKGKNLGHPCYNKKTQPKVDGWTCKICNQNFRTRQLLEKHKKEYHSKDEIIKSHKDCHFYECYCIYCGRKSYSKEGNTLHERYCKLNPNKEVRVGHKVSEETKQKISIGMKKAHSEGRANEWSGRKERSYAEQSWYNIFLKEKDLQNFKNNFFVKKYWLDFAWIDKKIYFEVDGETHSTEDGKLHDEERTTFLNKEGWTLIGRCNWSEYQKKSFEEKNQYVNDIFSKIRNF